MPAGVMLSGGATPVAAYQELGRRQVLAADRITMLYSDERHVPTDAPDSNYGMTLPLLRALALPDDRIIRVRTEFSLEEAAARYDRELAQFLLGGGRIGLGLLGLGTDGHTASLFTREDVSRGAGRYAIAVPKAQKPDRVSVTAGLLRQIERVIILVSGPGKRAILEKLLAAPDTVVAGMALADRPVVEIWHDIGHARA